MELNVLDLFSGIGGFSVGLEATEKFKTIGFCEQDKFCQKVLRKHWSDVPIYEDIKKLDARKIKADVVVGGFPCQSISIAGKQKEKMMTDTYSQKCLESLKKFNPDGLLAKMCQTLLTSQMDKSCKTYTIHWKQRITKSKLSILQLVRKELGTKGQESGSLLPTPTQDSVSERTKKYKQGGTPLTMAVRQMFPTPTVGCEEGGEQSSRVERTKSGSFILRKKNNPNSTFGAKLSDTMLFLEKEKFYNTPTTNDHKNLTFPKSQKNRTSIIGNLMKEKTINPGGKLNPNFVEFLMGYNMNYTQIEPTELKHLETQSSHKSLQKLAKQSLQQKKK